MTDSKDRHEVPPQSSRTAAHALGQAFRQQWDLVRDHPEMRAAFNQSVSQLAPYSGTIFPEVEVLEKGRCRVSIRDRAEVRNHLNSIHAIALANLAELSTGLTVLYSSPDDCRSIIVGLEIQYLKKARGRITAECLWDPPSEVVKKEHQLEVTLRDESDAEVAKAKVRWLLGPAPTPGGAN